MLSKIFHITSLLALAASSAFAMPAKQTPVSGTLPDGTPIEARLIGDENFHYYISSSDGSLLMRQGDSFRYADIDSDGRLVPSGSKVKAVMRKAAISKRLNTPQRRKISGLVPSATFPALGKQKIAVVLVEYQDVKFNLDNPNDYFTRMLNEEGFSDYRATGSARDWFLNSSAGMFDPEFDVYGPVTLQKKREYYGGNDAFGQDLSPQKMVIEACRLLNAEVDFSQYDRDNDEYIDNVFVVYAGRGEASGGAEECVWPHAWTIASAEPGANYTFDGVRLNRYACSNEWELSDQGYGYRPVGIGTFIHEFSHVMGLPDLYSTSYVEGTFTPGGWSVMDYGPYNNDGCTPPQYSAWERASLGYLNLTPLKSETANIALEPLGAGNAYIVTTDNENEYYVLENRQQIGWDKFIPGHGMLVWHIDYDPEIWTTNAVNNTPSFNRVDILEADGTQEESSRDGDAFPGASGITEISSSTNPGFLPRKGEAPDLALTDIKEIDDHIAFRVNGGVPDIEAPASVDVSEPSCSSITVTWTPVKNAKGYRIKAENSNIVAADISAKKVAANQYPILPEDPSELDQEVYVAGENSASYTFENLYPGIIYEISLAVDDGIFGSETVVRMAETLPPTLNYFAVSGLDAAEISKSSFLARWSPITGAETYNVDVVKQDIGDSSVDTEDFSNGVESLRPDWSSTSSATYGMSSYSGESAPSLRLSSDSDCLTVSSDEIITALSFWHRGNGTSDAETLKVFIPGEETDILIKEIPVVLEKGGLISEISLAEYKVTKACISFSRPTKGSLAIDDVKVTHAPLVYTPLYSALDAKANTELLVEGLTPGSDYKFRVTGNDGTYTTRPSDFFSVRTLDDSNAIIVEKENSDFILNVAGYTISTSIAVNVYDITGRLVASGATLIQLPSAGVYIVTSASGRTTKILIR